MARSIARLLTLVIITVFGVQLTGCVDDGFSGLSESSSPKQETISSDKFRHAKFVRRAMRKSVGVNGTQSELGLIFEVSDGFEKQKVIERMKTLERNKTLERYKVLERYEYVETIDGYAITIIDTTGSDDYDAFIMELIQDPEVAWFEPDFSMQMPVSTSSGSYEGQQVPWSVAAVGGESSWTKSGNGSGSVDVDVYIVDSGVSNSDLNIVENIDFRSDGVGDPSDVDGHGTHIAGIIGAVDNTYGLVGIAPGARIHNMKVLDDNGTTDVSVVVAAMEYLIAQKLANPSVPMVVNMSIGENIGTTTYTSLDLAVEAASQAGIICVVSAGNYGEDAALVTPAHVADAITVGAHSLSRVFSYYSNYGSKVDILAPGDDVVSLDNSDSGSKEKMSGTSMAAAHVTGAVALLVAKHPGMNSSQALAALLAKSKSDVTGAPAGTTPARLWVADENILLVVPNESSPSSQDIAKKNMFASWGFGVSFITASSSQAAFDQAFGSHHVVFVSEETNSGDVNTKLSNASIGVVSEESMLSDELGVADDRSFPYARTIAIANTSHYITSGFSSSINLYSTNQPSSAFIGTTAPGKQVLATWPEGPGLVALETGSQTYSIGAAAGRRVMLPFGGNDFDVNTLTNDGKLLLRRSLKWAAGNGGGGTPTQVTTGSVDVQIATGMDDVEEKVLTGSIYHDSSDLELSFDGSTNQLVGMRFRSINVPAGATITNAYIQFTVDETNSGTTALTIRGQNIGNAPAFTTSSYNVSGRAKTTASVAWVPSAWSSVGAAGSEQRTPNLSSVVGQIVGRGDWSSGNNMVLIIEGIGERTAESYDGSSSKAAKLHIDYEL